MVKNLTVTQNQLAIQNALNVADICTGYGTFNYGAAYWQYYYYGVVGGAYGGITSSGIPGYARSTAISGTTNYVQVSNANLAATYNWTPVINYRTSTNNGFVALFGDVNGTATQGAYNSATSPLNTCGYVIGGPSTPANSILTTDPTAMNTKVYHFLLDQGHTPLTAASITAQFNGNGACTTATTIPAGAVSMLVKTGGGATLVIDPVNNLLYCGEGQVFEIATVASGVWPFIDNLMYYVANAAKYGTNFTDMFIEDGQPNAVPAPWDTYWGANAGVPSK